MIFCFLSLPDVLVIEHIKVDFPITILIENIFILNRLFVGLSGTSQALLFSSCD